MNVAIVIAGGVGSRMGQQIPKQFINVRDKPVLIYTLEAFQAHPQVEAIEVVCIDGWEDILKAYAKQFGISKLNGLLKVERLVKSLFAMAYMGSREFCLMMTLLLFTMA